MDTNVLRYFGRSFKSAGMPHELRSHILLAPLTVLELLSQLGTHGADEAFLAVQTLVNIFDAKATGLLPWPTEVFRTSIFHLPERQDEVTSQINGAINSVLNSASAEDLFEVGKELRALLMKTTEEAAQNFENVRVGWHEEGPLPDLDHKAIFAHSIARRAEVHLDIKQPDYIVSRLDAYYIFDLVRIRNAANSRDYKALKRDNVNDLLDAELLVYLADPNLHLLTCDKGFKRVSRSSQANRVHVAAPAALSEPQSTIQIIKDILSSA